MSGTEGILGRGEIYAEDPCPGTVSYASLAGVILIAAAIILAILGWTGVLPADEVTLYPGFWFI